MIIRKNIQKKEFKKRKIEAYENAKKIKSNLQNERDSLVEKVNKIKIRIEFDLKN